MGKGKKLNGRYLYCIVDSNLSVNAGKIGIKENEVYTIPYQDISILVHDCAARAYEPKEEKILINYVKIHNDVIDFAFNKFDAIIPLRFNTIVKEEEKDSNKAVEKWLEEQYHDLKEKLNKLRGKQEYGVQVFIDREKIIQEILNENKRIIKLKKKIKSTNSPGFTYLYKQTLEKAIKEEQERVVTGTAREVYSLIKNHSIDTQLGKTRRSKEKVMLLNISCLVKKENVKKFREKLEKINELNNLSVRITGPWAPYSFV